MTAQLHITSPGNLHTVNNAWTRCRWTIRFWYKNGNTFQWNRIENPKITPCTNGPLTYDKGGKTTQWWKDSLFNKWCWGNWTATCKKKKLNYSLTPYTKISSKWIKELKVRPDTIKLLEENTGRTLSDINHSKILYDPPPRVMEIKRKVNKWDLIKLKSFCTEKETIKQGEKTTLRMGQNNSKWNNWQRINFPNI